MFKLLLKELNHKKTNIQKLLKEDRFLRHKLFGNLGYLTTYYVKKFLDRAKSRDDRRALRSESHKLKSLGIDVGLAMDN